MHKSLAQATEVDRSWNRELHRPMEGNAFHRIVEHPFYPFSVDVDEAAYVSIYRFLDSRQMPPKDVVPFERSVQAKPKEFASASPDLKFASVVAGVGMLLRKSNYKGSFSYDAVNEIAIETKGEDVRGYYSEFIRRVKDLSR